MPSSHAADPFHIARSRYLDAMAEFETQVIRVLRRGGVKVGNECLGQKLDKLASLNASCRLSKAAVARLHEIATGSGPLLDERNDIVHAAMDIVDLDGVAHALFSNTRLDDNSTSSIGRLISAAQFSRLEVRTRDLAKDMAAIGAPPAPAKKAPANAGASIVPIRKEG